MRKWLSNWIGKIIPPYAVLPIVMCFVFNSIVYFGVRLIDDNFVYYDFTTNFDRKVPFIPGFASIYLICYLFWIINYILIGNLGKKHLYEFVTAEMLSRVVCGICYILIPTTNIRPEIIGHGFWEEVMRWLYSVDEANNLFPSIHCLVSWFCYIGIRGMKQIPKWYRGFSCIFALLVCISTQVVKQHYMVDFIGGVLLAEGMFLLAKKTRISNSFQRVFEKANLLIWGERIATSDGRWEQHGK